MELVSRNVWYLIWNVWIFLYNRANLGLVLVRDINEKKLYFSLNDQPKIQIFNDIWSIYVLKVSKYRKHKYQVLPSSKKPTKFVHFFALASKSG